MIDGLIPYAAYRDSGVPGLGDVPEHWHVKKVRDEAQVVNGYPFDANRFSVSDGYPLIRIRDLNKAQTATRYGGPFIDAARIEPGDVLIGMDGEFNVGTWAGTEPALLNQRMCCVRGRLPITTQFLRLALPRPLKEINDVTWSTTVKHLASSQVERITFACPPLPEQAAIVRLLDHADRRIRRYVVAKRNLIALLNEQKQAIIHRAVTRGLDPHVRLKPSGVEWSGDVPEHWRVWQVGHFAQVGNGSTPSRGNAAYWSNGSYPWLNSSTVNHSPVSSADQFVTDVALRECHLPRVQPGSVLVAITGQGKTRGTAALLTIEATINQHIAFVTPRRDLARPEYLHLALVGAYRELRRISDDSGSTKGALTCGDIAHFKVAVPPRDEQGQIFTRIEREAHDLEAAMARTELEINLLREYRTRLIADVVTGKLDVRAAAARLPHDGDEPEPLDDLEALAEGDESEDEADLDAAADEAEA